MSQKSKPLKYLLFGLMFSAISYATEVSIVSSFIEDMTYSLIISVLVVLAVEGFKIQLLIDSGMNGTKVPFLVYAFIALSVFCTLMFTFNNLSEQNLDEVSTEYAGLIAESTDDKLELQQGVLENQREGKISPLQQELTTLLASVNSNRFASSGKLRTARNTRYNNAIAIERKWDAEINELKNDTIDDNLQRSQIQELEADKSEEYNRVYRKDSGPVEVWQGKVDQEKREAQARIRELQAEIGNVNSQIDSMIIELSGQTIDERKQENMDATETLRQTNKVHNDILAAPLRQLHMILFETPNYPRWWYLVVVVILSLSITFMVERGIIQAFKQYGVDSAIVQKRRGVSSLDKALRQIEEENRRTYASQRKSLTTKSDK